MSLSNIMIPRDRLTTLADTMADCRILYIQAPAGYGKTVFADQWLESRKEPNAMVSFDEYDNTTADICCKLNNALEDLSIEEEQSITVFTKDCEFNKAPAEFLMRAVNTLPKDLKACLVIDDLHYVTDSYAQKILKDFLIRLPAGFKICLLSRNSLPESFSVFYLKNELSFISEKELLFNAREIRALYKNRKISITNNEAEEILRFTEGWPIGINALVLSSDHVPSENMSNDWLESFLKTQVWELWDEPSREFMLATCIEEELSQGICNALT